MTTLLICFASGMAGMAVMFTLICFIPEISELVDRLLGRGKE